MMAWCSSISKWIIILCTDAPIPTLKKKFHPLANGKSKCQSPELLGQKSNFSKISEDSQLSTADCLYCTWCTFQEIAKNKIIKDKFLFALLRVDVNFFTLALLHVNILFSSSAFLISTTLLMKQNISHCCQCWGHHLHLYHQNFDTIFCLNEMFVTLDYWNLMSPQFII